MSQELGTTQELPARSSQTAPDPDMPITVRLGEAESLAQVFESDLPSFTSIGITADTLTNLTTTTDKLRSAEIEWTNHRFEKAEARKEWSRLSPEAYELRDDMVHAFRYGYRKNPEIQMQIDAIEEGNSHDDMLLDLGKLGTLGFNNPDQLQVIKYPTSTLELAMKYSYELATLYASATIGDLGSHPKKIARDKVYAELKGIMSEIREAGKYLFWKDEERRRLYSSQYRRHTNKVQRDN